MSYKPYPRYKPSGVEWIGEIPEGWTRMPIKYAAMVNPPQSITVTGLSDSDRVTFLPMERVSADGSISIKETRTFEEVKNGFTCFAEKDVILAKITPCFENGKGAFLDNLGSPVGFGSTEFHILRGEEDKSDPKYLYYITNSAQFRKVGEAFMTGAAGQKRISTEFVTSYILGIPPITEQTQISAFLDRKTAQIDKLIEIKRKQIELLKEERTAIINQAVTKGLNPAAKMKDSGIEWIGEIPDGWEIKRLKFIAQVRGGATKGRKLSASDSIKLPYLRVANVQDGYLNLSQMKEIEIQKSEISRYQLEVGDVLMNEGGDFDKLGRGAVWHGEISPCLHQNHVFAVRPNIARISNWISLYTQTDSAKKYFILNAKQTTNLASISSSNIKELPVVFPPKKDRDDVVQFVKMKMVEIDETISQAEQQIKLLQEYRTTLISDAVTGKIDIREEAA